MKHLSILSIGVACLAMMFSSCEKDPITGTVVLQNNEDQAVVIGKTLDLKTTSSPADFTGNLVWFSEKEEICTVTNEGVVTGISLGESKVFATSGTSIVASYTITVYDSKKYFKYDQKVYPVEYACLYIDTNDGFARFAFSQTPFGAYGPSEDTMPVSYIMIRLDINPEDGIDLATTSGVQFGCDTYYGKYCYYYSNSDISSGTLSVKQNASSTPEKPSVTFTLKSTDNYGNVFEIHYSGTFKQNDSWNWF